MEDSLKSLISRVERLEKDYRELQADYRRLKAADAFSGTEFKLTNDQGDVVAELGTTEDADPFFTLYDIKGQARFNILLQEGKPGIVLCDQDGNNRLILAEHVDGSLGLIMIGQYRRNRVLLGFSRKGEPYLQLAGTNGAIDLDTSLSPGWLGLTLQDEAKQNRLAVALEPSDHNGNPFMVLTNHRGQQRWWHAS